MQDAMSKVSILNAAFTAFDEEIQSPMVYKVETVGSVYMAVSGAPDMNPLHAEHAADLALNMIHRILTLDLPGVTVKIGIHSGPVVAGVVGLKVPRYCLFGDSVNVASRMVCAKNGDSIESTVVGRSQFVVCVCGIFERPYLYMAQIHSVDRMTALFELSAQLSNRRFSPFSWLFCHFNCDILIFRTKSFISQYYFVRFAHIGEQWTPE